tara:strand:+ start:1236 stop:1403 length:168 start_codon:yes stop_codon:yes gene_type:complete
MSITSFSHSNKYLYIASKRLRKGKCLNINKKKREKLIKNSSKEEKLIYAFFLDIA